MGKSKKNYEDVDVVLIGAGIMSATLGTLINELNPHVKIEMFERLDLVAAESSDAWNNAGTGHSALCELNYTPQKADGSVDIKKAISIAESFEISKQFWTYLVEKGIIKDPEGFIRSIPHMSCVFGERNVEFLKRRHATMIENTLFKGMEYSEDPEVLKEWIPLVMEGRPEGDKIAATKMDIGTDVNFGSLTRDLIDHLVTKDNFSLKLEHEVKDIEREGDGRWEIEVKDIKTGKKRDLKAQFVFIGAGGHSLLLLEKSGIPEAKGYGGFPVGGQWLRCTNEEVIAKHHAKVYGKASVGAPPMSVPHLDTRYIDGKQALLFGPYAGFSTKFLKKGSFFDLPASIKLSNIRPMLAAGWDNMDLTKYLITEVMKSPKDKLESLKEYMPNAKQEDWALEVAGQRVQVIKKDKKHGGVLEFGTEVVASADGSLAALLGASPGASTSVKIMVELLKKCFPDRAKTQEYRDKLREMIPTWGQSLAADPELCKTTRARTQKALKLD
ncbi:malate:quinone oxidoreductase [Sphingobacterium spiritivorum]|uniref:Probable malate:quinone oxidoreductase n=2 Tax=Sphingobacterium spiritivorum TaxID=258 RepID=D7VSK2_SPHSI|nr:malate:quinone oxidoreductase [Sphingobacterium spiritivorum]EFK56753.1 malate dehydrogenase (quinone) [Sphingobacterium spiritivorum ATCC 33861]QQT35213.1 malate:quinone oxidoreductase [Sphingobacterium spiritivorum]WQD36123.1 malate:quinone oxidoreductase [Sphingobacterium spiritivorum]SUJ03811.1 Malate:quinone oxidoreductase [Sphingobacterium spiritivorum]SUJ29347.1 Malate:quinone oxidoreductase [Sphingobacterium spiritivorum]